MLFCDQKGKPEAHLPCHFIVISASHMLEELLYIKSEIDGWHNAGAERQCTYYKEASGLLADGTVLLEVMLQLSSVLLQNVKQH